MSDEAETGAGFLKWLIGGTGLGGLLGAGMAAGSTRTKLAEHDRRLAEHERVDIAMHETMDASLSAINEKLGGIAEDVAYLKGIRKGGE